MLDRTPSQLVRLMSQGGDDRIVLDPQTGLNRYLTAPMPGIGIAYGSSTANDLSGAAHAHLEPLADPMTDLDARGYGAALDAFRDRISAAYGLGAAARIMFAPSGTDLEYVALAAHAGRMGGIRNILLAPDEVGSGCILSAAGQHFASSTALGVATRPGTPVAGLGPVALKHLRLRCNAGMPLTTDAVAHALAEMVRAALGRGMLPLVHVVHGSKTGLILPDLAGVDVLRDQFGDRIAFVVDACQARIAPADVRAYLDRGMIVLLSGSKFMGGAPFSGFALVPTALADAAPALPAGFANIFRRAEWPAGWAGRDALPHSANAGLLLRIASALFELDRFAILPGQRVQRVIGAFGEAVRRMADRAGVAICESEIDSLVTLDLRGLPDAPDFDEAVGMYRRMAARGVRLGQPVRCMPTYAGWGGTIRIALSMPQVVAFNSLTDRALHARLDGDMAAIADALRIAHEEAQRERLQEA